MNAAGISRKENPEFLLDDRRKFTRFNIDIPASIELLRPEGERAVHACRTLDLSAGGALIRSVPSLPEGTPIKMDFILQFSELETSTNPSGALKISVTGSVLRSIPEGMAIRFNEDYEIFLREDAEN